MHSLTLALGAIALLCGLLALALVHFPAGFVFLFWGIVIVVGVVFERYRYKPIMVQAPPGNWVRTSERFFNETGEPVTVWIDPETGERKYVAD
ncbi:MAG TPA: hypothetical protein VF410_01490 [Rhizomicrobium sp.]